MKKVLNRNVSWSVVLLIPEFVTKEFVKMKWSKQSCMLYVNCKSVQGKISNICQRICFLEPEYQSIHQNSPPWDKEDYLYCKHHNAPSTQHSILCKITKLKLNSFIIDCWLQNCKQCKDFWRTCKQIFPIGLSLINQTGRRYNAGMCDEDGYMELFSLSWKTEY